MLPSWLQYLQVAAVVLIPLIGAWIAWQQVQIARVKLQFELYGKRFVVFEAARRLIGEIISQGNISTSGLNACVLGTADAVFLLDDELSKYLGELAKHASILSNLKYAIEPLAVGSAQRVDLSQKTGEELKWFNNQADKLVARLKPYLKLDERKRRL
jgi:hypothetical protein